MGGKGIRVFIQSTEGTSWSVSRYLSLTRKDFGDLSKRIFGVPDTV